MAELDLEMLAGLETVETDEAGHAEQILIPKGSHIATIGIINLKEQMATGKNKKEEDWYSLRIPMEIAYSDPETGEAMEGVFYHKIFIDLVRTDEGTFRWDFRRGKNRALAILREAADQNNPGIPWSIGMLSGQTIGLDIIHADYVDKQGVALKEMKAARVYKV